MDAAVAWLREQVQARLDAAKAVGERSWRLEDNRSWPYWNGRNWEFGENASARNNVGTKWVIWGPRVTIQSSGDESYFLPDMAHIAANDPQQVIADCEMQLALLGKIAMMDGRDAGHLLPDLASAYRHQPDYAEHWPA